MPLSDFRSINGFDLLSQRVRGMTWSVYAGFFMHIFFNSKVFLNFSRVHFAHKAYFCMGFTPSFCTEEFCTFVFQGMLHFTCDFHGNKKQLNNKNKCKNGEVGGRWDQQTTEEDGTGEEKFRCSSRQKSHQKLLWQEGTNDKCGMF